MIINGIGALATGITTIVIIVAKFSEGAWITVITIPLLLVLMGSVRAHYRKVQREIAVSTPIEPVHLLQPIIVVCIHGWNRVTKEALHFAMSLSKDIKVLHAKEEADDEHDFTENWSKYVENPAKSANLPVPELIVLDSPYRYVISPMINYILRLAREHPTRRVVTVIPELVQKRWYQYFLHTQRASILKARLLMEGNDRISILNIPWYLKSS
ncbi:MAG: hypothetical protein JO061_01730 [Acidobacteriaceae bacterium]|nr:hypothetical protein [Acidobacteriaceae bacterium]